MMSANNARAKKKTGATDPGVARRDQRERALRVKQGYPEFLIRLVGAERLKSVSTDGPIEHRCD